MFANDANNTLWTSGGGQVVGWLNRKMFDETGDEEKSQGWTALIVDTNGNSKRDAYTEPNQPMDPAKDMRFGGGFYAVAPAPDGAIWGTVLGYPGTVVRLNPGSNPPETALAEIYQPPVETGAFSPRGGDVDRNGVYWAAMASGHMGSFDRRKCKGALNGPKATGLHCPEGWTFYPEPLPQMQGVTTPGSAEGSYYTWVDWFDTSGLGANTPINTGNLSEGPARAEGRQVGGDARPVPARVLHQVDGRPDRRSEGRMEGARPLGDHQHAYPVPHGNGEGDHQQGLQAAGQAGAVGQVGDRGSRVRGSRARKPVILRGNRPLNRCRLPLSTTGFRTREPRAPNPRVTAL